MLKVSLFLFFSLLVITHGYANDGPKTFYEGRFEGYYWYQDEKPEPDEKEKVKKYDYQEIWNMHPDQFKQYFDDVLKQAIQTQSEEDVLEFVKLKDIATRKSQSFAAITTFVQQQHPEYSPDLSSPVTAPGKRNKRIHKYTLFVSNLFCNRPNDSTNIAGLDLRNSLHCSAFLN